MATKQFPALRQWLCTTVFLAMSAAATYYMRIGPASAASGEYFAEILQPEPWRFPDSGVLLRRHYTGISAVDTFLSFLVAAFTPGAAGWNKAFRLQQMHFLFQFLPVIAVWSVEAAREGSAWKVISFTSLWAIPYQTVGGAIIIPLWFLAFTLTSSTTVFESNNSHRVPVSKARALLPALLLGYVVPTTLMFLPVNIETQQALVALWQPAPFIVNIIWYAYSTLISDQESATSVKDVKTVYAICGAISAIVHFGIIGTCLTSSDPQQSFYEVFVTQSRDTWTMSNALLFVFQVDWWIIFGAALICAYVVIWDLHVLGRADVGTAQAIGMTTIAAIVLGPGAALCGVWYWREGKLGNARAKTA